MYSPPQPPLYEVERGSKKLFINVFSLFAQAERRKA
jgi:hypothetical protein